ncbi:diguanylate cyclase [Pseudogulbenkiania ferrooxidans]|uniref:diguanylate cyclase n=1 Tax=Pseudogulbenkiania ferrooxidans 2002 TaxID=279714 RepID=B9Z2F9_9NEIS|nr:diguanylate cyclase [Pseudogulbenkiania ferrooxidans]EEG08762.1 response regulator receiver modulated diguanylate cyclase [Pseudogulbenkiania ferrooxidans 2002]
MKTPKRVLVIEDSTMLIRPVCRMVEELGFEAVPVMSLAELEQQLASEVHFSAAVADYCLPDAPSGEALPPLFRAGIPTIVLTAHNDQQTRDDILSMPVVDYIPKDSPSALDYLMRMLKRIDRNPQIKVLVVDDSHTTRSLLRDYLRRHLYQVLEAVDAEAALQILREHSDVSLVLADYGMPGMDGAQMTSAIRRLYTHTRLAIVGISVQQDKTMTPRFLKAGADDYLQKPFTFEEFTCRITRNIEFVENLMTLEHLAHADPLTGLSNRRHLFEQVQKIRGAYGIAIIDIDHFKQINDGFGHDVGDVVIQHLADRLREHFPRAIVARFGGEEFVVLMKRDAAHPLAQRLEELRQEVEREEVDSHKGTVRYTISIGMAAATAPDIRELLRLADERLYKAKQNGRNRVCAS